MFNNNLVVFIFLLALSLNGYSTVWRVNNHTNIHSDFKTLQEAINGASDSDTLYLEGSSTSYGDGVLNKKLVIIGTGYWLNENNFTQANKDAVTVNRIQFQAGSQGSKLCGLVVTATLGNGESLINIDTDSICVERCLITAGNGFASGSYGIRINGNYNNILIRQNFISTLTGQQYSSMVAIYLPSIPSQTIICNNFIRSSHNAIHMAQTNSLTGLLIFNNVIWGAITTYYSTQYNNILVEGSYNNHVSDQCYNNLCNSVQYPQTNNNQQNVPMQYVFVSYQKYIDNGYILRPNSLAAGAALNGGDCGVFGDSGSGIVYYLSGMPAIPSVYESTVNPAGTTGIQVNIKATSHP